MQPKFDRPRLPAEVSHPLPLHIDDSVVGVHRNSVADTVVNEHALIDVGDIAVLALTSRPSAAGHPVHARSHRAGTQRSASTTHSGGGVIAAVGVVPPR